VVIASAKKKNNLEYCGNCECKKEKENLDIVAIASVKKQKNLEYFGNCKCKKAKKSRIFWRLQV
jgi:hypothetical protein